MTLPPALQAILDEFPEIGVIYGDTRGLASHTSDEVRTALLRAWEAGVKASADIATALQTGVAVEISGEQHLLGIMQNKPGPAQKSTALAISAAIKSLIPKGDTT